MDDLTAIWDYVADYDVAAADNLIDRFDRAIRRLEDFPRLGGLREVLGQGLRAWLIESHLVIYLLDDDLQIVDIIRVVDGRRDLESLNFDP